jgi:hypothetical protein
MRQEYKNANKETFEDVLSDLFQDVTINYG